MENGNENLYEQVVEAKINMLGWDMHIVNNIDFNEHTPFTQTVWDIVDTIAKKYYKDENNEYPISLNFSDDKAMLEICGGLTPYNEFTVDITDDLKRYYIDR